ncbi:MAG: hypothetical protein KatS3mg115_2196 [Candidatus Poribacteria bacterium]|nr:MAG: hypothetical protein KatS3mg115_2196 [Candidatus Poribacteria bacterium]
MDDWGSQTALLISPAQWREFFKPLYADYCRILHAADKFVFFHSDGHIEAIYGDLIEIGVDAINSQLFCMNIERLGRLYRGKVTFWGEIDRQGVLAFGTPQDGTGGGSEGAPGAGHRPWGCDRSVRVGIGHAAGERARRL